MPPFNLLARSRYSLGSWDWLAAGLQRLISPGPCPPGAPSMAREAKK